MGGERPAGSPAPGHLSLSVEADGILPLRAACLECAAVRHHGSVPEAGPVAWWWQRYLGLPRWGRGLVLAGSAASVVVALVAAVGGGGGTEVEEPVGDGGATPTTVSTRVDRLPSTPGAATSRPGLAGPGAGVPDGDDRVVERIVDGDTIVVVVGARVRLIGIDTPESVDPRRPVECFGREASAHIGSLAPPGTAVRLVYDVERVDRFGRALAYVYRLADGLFVNGAMVGDGYAQVFTVPPNVRHTDELLALQREAREAGRGLWSACPADDTAGSGAAASSACDRSYPDACIPSPPPDLDCGDVPHRRFRVEGPDPHRFDGDGDGLGCE